MKRWLSLVPLALVASCGPKANDAYLGQWFGGFKFDSFKPGSEGPLVGYVQLYAHQNFWLHLENKYQGWDVRGSWNVAGKRLELVPTKFEYQTPSELDQAAYSYRAIKQEDIRALYGSKFFLKVSDDRSTLEGLEASLGAFAGLHEFNRRQRPNS